MMAAGAQDCLPARVAMPAANVASYPSHFGCNSHSQLQCIMFFFFSSLMLRMNHMHYYVPYICIS